jgi:hypothetical protein
MLVEIACTVFPLIEKKFLLPANDYRTSVQEELNLALLILVSMLDSHFVCMSRRTI